MSRRPFSAAALALALALAACASASPDSGSSGAATAQGSAVLRIGETARLGGLSVRALGLVEDSRCPASVVCIQAGTVRVAVRLGEGGTARDTVLSLGQPEPLGGGRVLRLTGACPSPNSPGGRLPEAQYRFHLTAAAAGAEAAPPPICAAR
jgi:hypothetical protein